MWTFVKKKVCERQTLEMCEAMSQSEAACGERCGRWRRRGEEIEAALYSGVGVPGPSENTTGKLGSINTL